jgi:hypothetical protein
MYGGIRFCFLMMFLNHHYTHNSDVRTCARLKRTPTTINITNHDRVKQTDHKSTGGVPPCFHLVTKAAQSAGQKAIAVIKPYRWRPGMVAAREIHKFHKTTGLLIRKAPFQHLVQEVALKFGKSDLRMQSTVVLALQGSPGGCGILHG